MRCFIYSNVDGILSLSLSLILHSIRYFDSEFNQLASPGKVAENEKEKKEENKEEKMEER